MDDVTIDNWHDPGAQGKRSVNLSGSVTIRQAAALHEGVLDAWGTARKPRAELSGMTQADLTGFTFLDARHGSPLKRGKLFCARCRLPLGQRGTLMARLIMTAQAWARVREQVSFTRGEGGYQMLEGGDGRLALQQPAGTRVELVTTDQNRPNLGGIGLDAGGRTRIRRRFIPRRLLTTQSRDFRQKEGPAAGATGRMVEPCKPGQPMAVVGKVAQ